MRAVCVRLTDRRWVQLPDRVERREVEVVIKLGERALEVALLRVLYAHSLVAAPRFALGRLAVLGRALGDPRVGMTGAFLSLSRVVPDRYPLEDIVLERFIQDENRLGRMLDYVIGPRLQALMSSQVSAGATT